MHFDLKRDWQFATLILLTIIFAAPLWWVQTPDMPDYPAHLAGFQLIAGGAAHSPFYAVRWQLLPNLASDILVPPLAHVVGIEAAVKLFLTATVAMWVSGAALIQRALTGRIGAASLAGALFATNANFTWGFLNYTFSAGLAFMIFAAWVALAKRRTPVTIAGFAVATFALYVCHLFAACVLAALIGLFELSAVLQARAFAPKQLIHRAAEIAGVFLPVGIAFLFFKSAGSKGGGIEFNYGDTIGDRFGSAAQWAFSEPAYLVIGGLAILIFAGLLYGKIRLHPTMKLTVIGIAAVTLIAPEWALGGWGIDLRFPAVLGVITFAGLELRTSKWLTASVAAGVVLLAAANAASLLVDWTAHDKQMKEFRTALKELPHGVKIFTVLDGDSLEDLSDPPYWHMAEFAITDRGGFTPLMFATKGQHIIALRPPYDKLAAATAQQGSPPDVTELGNLALGRSQDDPDIDDVFPYLKYFQCHFDYAVVIRGPGDTADVPTFMTQTHAGSFFTIYAIHPTGICATR